MSTKDTIARAVRAGEAYREALDELSKVAPAAFEGRQEGAENFTGIARRLIDQSAWLERRLATLEGPPRPTLTEAGKARRLAALEAAKAADDQATVDRLTAELAELGASS